MCNAVSEKFNMNISDYRHLSRNKLHKYLIRECTDEKILNEVSSANAPCIYEQTASRHSSLFLALVKRKENVIKKLLQIYENDFKALHSNKYCEDDSCVALIAFGADDKKYVQDKLSMLTNSEGDKRYFILFKNSNENVDDVIALSTPKTEDDKRILLQIIDRLHGNGTFDVNIRNLHQQTLFDVAAYQGMIGVMEKLIELGTRCDEILTAFHYACVNNQIDAVKWLHRKFKIDLLKFMTEGNFVFELAANGSKEVFHYIINEIEKFDGQEHFVEIFQRKSSEYHQSNVLHTAALNQQYKFLLDFIGNASHLHDVDHSGLNLLHIVLRNPKPDIECVRYLLEKCPDLVVMENSNQWIPMHLLATKNFLQEITEIYQKFPFYKSSFFKNFADTPSLEKEIAKIWVESPGHGALRDVVKSNFLEMFDFIINNHDQIEFENSPYISGLACLAAENDDGIEMIKKLSKLEFFDLNTPNENGKFPLISALNARKFENFHFLLKLCKNPNEIIDKASGLNLVGLAIYHKPLESPKMLQNCDIEIFSSDEDEKTENENFDEINRKFIEEQKKIEDEMFVCFHDLILKGVDIKHHGKDNRNLIHVAVDADNLRIMEFLVKQNLKIDEIDDLGENVFHLVRSKEIFQLLLDNLTEDPIALINQKSKKNSTPFGKFIINSANQELPNENLINEFQNLKAQILCCGSNPFHYISSIKLAKILLDYGVDPNGVNEIGENSVHLALKNQNFDYARYLIMNSEIDRFALTIEGNSILHYLMHGEDYKKLFTPALERLSDELLDKFINEKNIEGRLILNVMIESGCKKVFNHPKVNFHQIDINNMTCLHSAAMSDVPIEIIKILLEKGIDVNATNEQGSTALMLSIDRMKNEIATLLINQENVDLNLANIHNQTALHYAARHDNVTLICKLLSKGAAPSISTLNKYNQTFYDLLSDFSKKLFIEYKIIVNEE